MMQSPQWQLALFAAVIFVVAAFITISQSINQSAVSISNTLFQSHSANKRSIYQRINPSTHPSVHQVHSFDQTITTLKLCEPIEHSQSNQTFGDEWWPKLAIPSNNEAFNQTTLYWKFYDLSISEQGEILLPLTRGSRVNDGSWRVDWFNDQDHGWLRDLSNNQAISCSVTYTDQTTDHSTVSAREGGSDMPNAICPFNPLKIPRLISLMINDHRHPIEAINQSYHYQSLNLSICSFTTPRYYAVGMITALYSLNADVIIDWLTYHTLLGIDHLYIHHRYQISDESYSRLSPLIESGLLTLVRWPIQHNSNGKASLYGDQMLLLNLFSIRIAHHSTWVLVVDMDEYLKINLPFQSTDQSTNQPINQPVVKSRSCMNSIRCDSTIKTWLQTKRQYSMVSFYTINVVASLPPAQLRTLADQYRYAYAEQTDSSNKQSNNRSNNQLIRLPLAVQRIWRRSFWKGTISAHNKYFYQPLNNLGLSIHGGAGTRGQWGDQTREQACAFHYHPYPIWSERGQKNELNESEKEEIVKSFWSDEAVRDTYASDVYEQLKWPLDANRTMLNIIKPYGWSV